MKKLKLDVDTLTVEQFQAGAAMKIEEGTVQGRQAAMSGWYSDPCRFCDAYPISVTPNVC
jgi:hypothetical protein